MSSTEKRSLDDEVFFNELSKNIKRFAKRHGYEVPDFNGLITKDGAIFMNIAAYSGKARTHYERMYREHAHEIGLELSWLGAEVFSLDKSTKYTLIGLDPDGGKHCLRLCDQNGKEMHMTPAGFTHLMLVSGG